MKKIMSLLLSVMLTVVFFGCSDNRIGTQDENAEEVKKMVYSDDIYDELRDKYFEYLIGGAENDGMEGTYGLEEVVRSEEQNAVNVVGYSVRDINGDDVPEFLVGLTDEYCRGVVNNQLYVLYTCKNGEPVLVFEGWSRNIHALTDDGILVCGANNAAESTLGSFVLPVESVKLQCKDYYFSKEVDGKIQFFHNESGELNPDNSEEVTMNSEEFFELRNELAKKTLTLGLAPFSELKDFEEQIVSGKTANIKVVLADELIESSSEYDTFVINDMNGATMLAFCTDVTVTEFCVNSVEYDYSNNGQQHIFETLAYEYGELNPARPLVLKMIIPEGMPQYDISYMDADGTKRSFTVLESGETGEFFLHEINIG